MRSISARVSKKTGVTKWQAIVRNPGQATLVATRPTREAAEAFAEKAERDYRRQFYDPSSTLPASGDLLDERLLTTISLYAKSPKRRAAHIPKIAMLKKHVGEHVLIRDLDDDWVRDFISNMTCRISKRKLPYKPATAVGLVVLINVILKWRAHELRITKPYFVVTDRLFPPGWDAIRNRRLETGEEKAILDHMRTKARRAKKVERNRALAYQLRLMFRLALETAGRLQELAFAEWTEFSSRFTMWDMPAQHTKCRKPRVVPLSPTASRILRLLWRMRDPDSPRIFHVVKTPRDASDWFRKTFRSAKVPNLRFHDCRHEAIARFVLHPDRYEVPRLMKIVGHKDYETFDRYITFRLAELQGFMVRK